MKSLDSMRARQNIALLRVVSVALIGLAAGVFMLYRGSEQGVKNAWVWTALGILTLLGAATMGVGIVQIVRGIRRASQRTDKSKS